MNNLVFFSQALNSVKAGRKLVLATVVETWRSAPVGVGARMIVDDSGEFWGSVSGGCIENEIIHIALNDYPAQNARLLRYGISKSKAWMHGLSCGGSIKIWVEALSDKELLEQIVTGLSRREKWVQLIDGKSLSKFVRKCEIPVVEHKETAFFSFPLYSQHQLIIVGAVHIAQELALIALRHNYLVYIIDPRSIWIDENRFDNIQRVNEWPSEALPKMQLDEMTAICVLSHDSKIDDDALIYALNSEVGYIGALGSNKSHEMRCKRLLDQGVSNKLLEKINAPIGLDIGAIGASEIAVSIMSQLIKHFSKR